VHPYRSYVLVSRSQIVQNYAAVRMKVPKAMMVVSARHIDYERRDIALEHGSDRHSTFAGFKC